MFITNSLKRSAKRLLGKNLGANVRALKLNLEKKLYTKQITKDDLRAALEQVGPWHNRIVWVQSSWTQFYNVKMRPMELIELMLDMVGPQGTLVMPAFPINMDPTKIFYVDRAPTNTGLVTELFRRMPGVKRSIHLRASVCALGPAADEIVSKHHLTEYPWGRGSPFGQLKELRGLMISLGFTKLGFTPLHYVECELHHEVKLFERVFDGHVTYHWQRNSGETGTHRFINRVGVINPPKLARYFPSDLHREVNISNLYVASLPAHEGIERLSDLAKQGITIYPDL